MKPTAHHYFAVIIALAVLTASIVGYIFIDIQVSHQTAQTAIAYANMEKAQATAAQESTLVQSLASTSDARALIQTFFLPANNTVFFIEQVEGVGGQSGASVSIASISADNLSNSPAGTVGSLEAHIQITGTWPNVMRAMHLVEDLPYVLTIDNVNVLSESGGIWTVGFDIKTLIIE